jgi:hypothetical protein
MMLPLSPYPAIYEDSLINPKLIHANLEVVCYCNSVLTFRHAPTKQLSAGKMWGNLRAYKTCQHKVT